MPLAPGQRLSHYRLVEKIGEGGMGAVWEAWDEKLRRAVALKVLPDELIGDPERRRRLLREARAAAAINHPNIATVYEVNEAEDCVFITMERVEGTSLRALLSGKALDVPEVLRLAAEMAEGLDAAHGASVIHRDLKPENVMVRLDGHVKILDFGLAKSLEEPVPSDSEPSQVETATQRMTREGAVLGTPAYMSPEQARGIAVDLRSDLFSLGATVYEMATGTTPFRGRSHFETLSAILHQPAAAPSSVQPGLPRELDRILLKCLEKKVEERFQKAGDVAADLRALQADMASGAVAGRASRSLPWLLGLGVALAAAVTAAGLYFKWPGAGPVKPPVASVLPLPCKVFSDEEDRFLTDAVPGMLARTLSRVTALDTRRPPSSFRVSPDDMDVAEIARLYGVDSCVTCSVTVDEERFVLAVELVEPLSDRLLWSEEYEGSRSAYIQLARRAAEGVRSILVPTAPQDAAIVPPDRDPAAEEAYQLGVHFKDRYNKLREEADYDRAHVSLEKALTLEPALADAAAHLAGLHAMRLETDGDVEAEMPRVVEWARRALTIDERCGLAWAALAYMEVLNPHGVLQNRLDYGLKAVAYHQGNADALFPIWTPGFLIGLELLREASRLEPLHVQTRINMSASLYYLGRFAEGLQVLDEALALEPAAGDALWRRTLLQASLGNLDVGVDETIARLQVPPWKILLVRHAVARTRGDMLAAAEHLDAIMETVRDPDASPDFLIWIYLETAPYLAQDGAVEPAMEILTRAADAGSEMIYEWLVLHPGIEPLRQDLRFAALLDRGRVQHEEMLAILNRARERGELPAVLEATVDALSDTLEGSS